MIPRNISLQVGLCIPIAIGAALPQAVAQNANDLFRLFDGLAHSAIAQTALAEWRKFPPTETACIDQEFRKRGSNIQLLASHGITPSDPRIYDVRTACGAQIKQQAIPDGLTAGVEVTPDSIVSSSNARGWLGVQVRPAPAEVAPTLGIHGVLVVSTVGNSPAVQAGIIPGDVIYSLSGNAIRSARDLIAAVAALQPGANVEIAIIRNGTQRTVSAKLGEAPNETAQASSPSSPVSPYGGPTEQAPSLPSRSTNSAALVIPSCETIVNYNGGSYDNNEFRRTFGLTIQDATIADIDRLIAATRSCRFSNRSGVDTSASVTFNIIKTFRGIKENKEQAAEQIQQFHRFWQQVRQEFEALSADFSALEPSPSNRTRLEQMQSTLQRQQLPLRHTIGASGPFERTWEEMYQLKDSLLKKITEKLVVVARSQLVDRANKAASVHSGQISSMRIPTTLIDAMIFLGLQQPTKFLTLRQLIGLLLDTDGISASAQKTSEGIALSVKKPGSRTFSFTFANDGGELFLAGAMDGDREYNFNNPLDQSYATTLLRQFAEPLK